MNVTKLEMDRYIARDHWRNYLKDRHYAKPIDAQIARVYKQLAMGKTVIRALESIKLAGLNAQGLPKLAIAGAEWPRCSCLMEQDGAVQ